MNAKDFEGHTPGPWQKIKRRDHCVIQSMLRDCGTIALVYKEIDADLIIQACKIPALRLDKQQLEVENNELLRQRDMLLAIIKHIVSLQYPIGSAQTICKTAIAECEKGEK
jgi:hypothetical protein